MYETGTATGTLDLLDKLLTFATANGWTQDDPRSGGKMAMHRGNIYVSFAYDTGSPSVIAGPYQALGFTATNAPGTHPDDSGQGYTGSFPYSNANIFTGRHMNPGSGAFPSYHFFDSDTGPYLHVVVEISTGDFRHFGMGKYIALGDTITGGEYAYGHRAIGSNPSCLNPDTTTLLDGFQSQNGEYSGTIHLESLPDPPHASTKWALTWANWATAQGNDRQGTPRERAFVQGGFRGGPEARSLGIFAAGSQSGKIPGYPISLWYRPKNGTAAQNDLYYIGYMPDVRGVNIRYMSPGETINIGGDDWLFFPTTQRDLTTSINSASQAQGIMYKKVTT